jgi:carbonic anhydrase
MHRRQVLKIFAGIAACPLCTTIGVAAEGHHWSYEGETGPDKWGGLDTANATCSIGSQQSPVDIIGTVSAQQPQLKIDWKRPDTIVNNGHTIQLNLSQGGTLQVGDRNFKLVQFHFHHPSEHLVAGKRFAMEVHFVHAAEGGGLAVVGAMLVAGAANTSFNKIISTMPQAEGPPAAADAGIDPAQLLPAGRGYYHYQGSLTTPPCSETVDWHVLTQPVEAAEADIASFGKLFPMNARPVQKLDRRFILSSG